MCFIGSYDLHAPGQRDDRGDHRIKAERCCPSVVVSVSSAKQSQDDEVSMGDKNEAHDAGTERETGREKRIQSPEQGTQHALVS